MSSSHTGLLHHLQLPPVFLSWLQKTNCLKSPRPTMLFLTPYLPVLD